MPTAKIVELPNHFSKPPHTCIVTGRRDGPVVDFGKDYTGIDPHVYIYADTVEEAAKLLGMVPETTVQAMAERLDASEREVARLTELVESMEGLEVARQRAREALRADAVADQRQEAPMANVLHLSKNETVELYKVTALECHTEEVTVKAGEADPVQLAAGDGPLLDPQGPVRVTGPGRIRYWVEGEAGAPQPPKPKAAPKRTRGRSSRKKASAKS